MKKGLYAIFGVGLVIGLAGVAFLVYTYVAGGEGDQGEAEVPTLQADADANQVVYVISKDESRVTFQLQEDLRGVRTTVIGTTSDVAGSVLVDFDTPANSQVSMIQVDASELATDNDFRNRAIRANILETNQYVYIEFTPTQILNFPENPQIGQPITFAIVGDLKIRDITQTVTFNATVTLIDDARMEGTATTQVLRDDYNLTIPNAPGVANVTNEVQLTIDFVALASNPVAENPPTDEPATSTEEATD